MSVVTTAHPFFVTSRYVAVQERIINTAREKLHSFQVEERQTEWAARRGGQTRRVPLYSPLRAFGADYIRFPRFCLSRVLWAFKLGAKPPNPAIVFLDRPAQPPEPILLKPEFAPTEVQAAALRHLQKHHFNGAALTDCRSSAVVVLDTGQGKTLLALAAFALLASPVAAGSIDIPARPPMAARMLYITPTHALVSQAADDFRKWLAPPLIAADGNPLIATEATRFCRICILNIDAAIQIIEAGDRTFFDHFDFVVYDEVPKYCTATRRDIFWYKGRVTLALTAEPEARSDALDVLFHAHCGPIVTPHDYDAPELGAIPFRIVTHNYSSNASDHKTRFKPVYNRTTSSLSYLESVDSCLASDDQRNRFIATMALRIFNEGRRLFVFAHHVDHVARLAREIRTEALGSKLALIPQVFILSQKVPEDAAEQIRAADIVVATYSAGTVGISKGDARALIAAVPPYATGKKQVAGRITRLDPLNPANDAIIREYHVIRDLQQYWLRNHVRDFVDYLAKSPNKIDGGATSFDSDQPERANLGGDTPFDMFAT